MMIDRACLILAAAALLAAPQSVCAQAVQLPTFRYFSVQTTVSVPDRGGMVLGGVNSSSSGSTSRGFGPLRSRASGSNIGASTVSVHATIIDHNELDQAVLAEARARRGDLPLMLQPARNVDPAIAAKSDFLSRNIATRANDPPPPIAIEPPVESDKLAAGIAAEASGKLASARGAYEAAIRLGDDEIRSEASARLARIALPAKGAKVAGGK
jgi:hypothetical protein